MTDNDAETTTRPLAPEVVRMIMTKHRGAVPIEFHSSNGLHPIVHRSPDVLAYSPKDGRRLGSLGTPEIAAHRDEVVLLDTRRVPTEEELRAIRVKDGKVIQ